ncbi:hypothetical protein AA313_de0201267 [Arthrobotrys entomopaga]|nr:hypothetical protein AA313_de0201267 [Arthrobotrys entomopaga]
MSDEFPLLEGLGLYASDIIGDGDCLFRSFSDQLYGTQAKAHEIRLRTVSYMRTHASYFKLFLSVSPPSHRKTRSSTTAPSSAAIDKTFTDHVTRMEKSGVYGDNIEIVAFARCYGVNVKIYQREFAYQVSCSDGDGDSPSDENDGDGEGNQGEPPRLLHIAYHDWEHYSSVRNVDGPHKGLPNVSPKQITEEGKKKQKDALDKGVVIMPWMEKVVEASLPGFVGKGKVREMLEKCKGNVNLAVSKLLDEVEDEEGEGNVGNDDDAMGEPVVENSSKDSTTTGEMVNGKKKKKKQNVEANGDAKPGGGKQIAKPGNRPKKETGRERKERLQREKAEKKKAKSSGSKDNEPSTSTDAAKVSDEGIKTLHV